MLKLSASVKIYILFEITIDFKSIYYIFKNYNICENYISGNKMSSVVQLQYTNRIFILTINYKLKPNESTLILHEF